MQVPADGDSVQKWTNGKVAADPRQLISTVACTLPVQPNCLNSQHQVRAPPTLINRTCLHSRARRKQRAGLDVGWGADSALPMESLGRDRWQLQRTLQPGRYPYKFIMDGVWSYDADLPLVDDGDNINNVVEVVPPELGESDLLARARVLKSGGRLTHAEARRLHDLLRVTS